MFITYYDKKKYLQPFDIETRNMFTIIQFIRVNISQNSSNHTFLET